MTDTLKTLEAANLLLSDSNIESTFEYPGFIQIPFLGRLYQFGAANECYGFDILDDDNQVVSSDDLIGLEATPEELAEAIRETVE